MNGIQEVSGSNPLISTRKKPCNLNDYRVFSILLIINYIVSCVESVWNGTKIFESIKYPLHV